MTATVANVVVNLLPAYPATTYAQVASLAELLATDAITFAQQLGVKEAWLVHMSHHIQPHAEEEKTLPPGIHLAYDGEVITF